MRGAHKLLLALLLAGLVVRAVPLGYYAYYDPDHFYHARLAEQLVAGQGVPVVDLLSYGGRPYTYYPLYHELLALPMLLLGVDSRVAFALVSLLFALAAMLAFYALVKKGWGERAALGGLLFFALTPLAFARETVFSRPDGLGLALLAVMALGVAGKRLLSVALGALALALANLPGALFAAPLFSLWAFLGRERREQEAALTAVFFLVVGLFYYAALPWGSFQLSSVTLTSEEIRSLDLLSLFAYGGVVWLFAAWGLLVSRSKRERWARLPAWGWAWLGLGVASILAAIRNLALAAVPVSLVAGIGFEEGLRKTKPYGSVLVGIVLLGLAVQAGVYYDNLKPLASPGLLDALRWADGHVPLNATFLSLWDRGHLITGVAERRVVMDGYFEFAPDPTARNAAIISFFHGTEGNAVRVMRQWNATHVLVDDRMKDVIPSSTALKQLDSWGSFEKVFDNGVARIYRLRGS